MVRYTDTLVQQGGHVPADLRDELAREFNRTELAELTLTITIASAFSKAAIAWGPPPQIPVMEVPTPGPDRDVNDVLK